MKNEDTYHPDIFPFTKYAPLQQKFYSDDQHFQISLRIYSITERPTRRARALESCQTRPPSAGRKAQNRLARRPGNPAKQEASALSTAGINVGGRRPGRFDRSVRARMAWRAGDGTAVAAADRGGWAGRVAGERRGRSAGRPRAPPLPLRPARRLADRAGRPTDERQPALRCLGVII